MVLPIVIGVVALGGLIFGGSGCSETPAPRGPVAKPEDNDDGKSWWDRVDDGTTPPPRETKDPPKTEVPPEVKPPVNPNDLDRDGFEMCKSPDELLKQVEEGMVTCDCNDDNKNINPNAADNVGDFAEYTDKDGNVVKVPDQNCDLVDGVDVDKDGHASVASGGKDCDDNKANVKPGGTNRLNSKVDWDCDGEKGDLDLAKDTVRITGEITAMAMGDVDGDGFDDVVVSNVDGGGEFGIYFGKNLVAGGIKVFPDNADVLVQGNILDLGLGSALAMVDTDGDGKMEIVAGTASYNSKDAKDFGVGDGSASGGLAIFKGRANWPANMQVTSMEDPAILAGLDAAVIKWPDGYVAGQDIFVLHDIDGDGVKEIASGNEHNFLQIIPAQNYVGYNTIAQIAQSNPGKTRVIKDMTGTGIGDGSYAGFVVSGDVDGDGAAELMMGDPYDYANGSTGKVVLIKGGANLPSDINLHTIQNYQGLKYLFFSGNAQGYAAGSRLAISNVNGQASPELIIGTNNEHRIFCAPTNPINQIWAGNHPKFVNGSTIKLNGDIYDMGGISFEDPGTPNSNIAKGGLAVNSDTDGDGVNDFFIGASNYAGNSSIGFHFSGFGTMGLAQNSAVHITDADFALDGNQGFGQKVIGGGDVDGDGTGDVLSKHNGGVTLMFGGN